MDKKKLRSALLDARGHYHAMVAELNNLSKKCRLTSDVYLRLATLCIQWNSSIRAIEEQLTAPDSDKTE